MPIIEGHGEPLSRADAQKLMQYHSGTIRVRVEYPWNPTPTITGGAWCSLFPDVENYATETSNKQFNFIIGFAEGNDTTATYIYSIRVYGGSLATRLYCKQVSMTRV